ncbi:MAG: transcription elongation factor GreA [Dehalococcoidia bacterium]|nr:transcription elongation factor GreA [Dehalococcoidia bacterium]
MTSPEQRTENPSDDTDYTVNTLFQRYVQEAFTKDSKTLSSQKKKAAQTEISRFVRHLGSDRSIRTIIPSEIGEYSNDFVKRTSQTEHEKIKSVKKFLAFLVNNQYTNANLSQHLRLRRSRRTRTLKSIATKSVNLTQSGYDDMKVQLSQLQKERIRLTGEIERAAADGDVRENAPLEAARENQAMVMSKMRDIESTLKIAEIIDSKTNDTRVQVGSKVSLVQSESGMKLDYQLVEPREASPLHKKISIQSPVGEAILGRRVGDEVTVNTPAGQQTYKVEKTA